MLILSQGTSHKIQLTTSAAGDIETNVSYVDKTGTGPASYSFAGVGDPLASITSATTTDILAGAASTERSIRHLSFYNNHATQSVTCTVLEVDGTHTSNHALAVLLPGEALKLDAAGVWRHYDSNGGIYASTAKLDVKLRVTADQAFATAATLADITDLSSTPIKSGKRYNFEICLFTTNNASTTGSQFAINGPTATSFQVGGLGAVTNSATALTSSGGTQTTVNSVIIAQTTGQTATGMHYFMGYYEPSADGTFAVRCTSEVTVANGCVVKKGSWLRLWETDN